MRVITVAVCAMDEAESGKWEITVAVCAIDSGKLVYVTRISSKSIAFLQLNVFKGDACQLSVVESAIGLSTRVVD